MIEDGGQHGIKVSDGMQQSLGLAWNSKMTISVKTGPIQKHLRRKKLVVKLVDLLLLCDYCTILKVQYLIFSQIIAYCTPLAIELKEKWLHCCFQNHLYSYTTNDHKPWRIPAVMGF